MTTLERLFVEVFERKNGIIQQIKLQRDLYYKDLLSKSLIHGIPPPPWLWNYANSNSLLSDPKDLNKEELISQLLFPHSRVGIHASTGTTSHAQVAADGVISTVSVASGQTPGNDHITRPPACVDIDPGCGSVSDPQSSPQDSTRLRTSNIFKPPDQSLVRIHRSKSRQKALELRTSSRAAHKSCLSHEHKTLSSNVMVDPQEPDCAPEFSGFNSESMAADVNGGNLSNGICTINYSGRATRSTTSTCKQSSSATEPLKLERSHELVRKDDGTNRESCATRRAKGMEVGKENGTGYCGRITRSKSSCTHQTYLNDESFKLGRSSRIASKDGCTLAQPMANNPQHVNKDPEGVVPFDVSGEPSKVREAATGNCVERKKGSGMYSGRITRSMKSGQNLSSANDSVALYMSFGVSKVDDGTLGQSNGKLDQHLDKANEILGVDPFGEGNKLAHTSNISLEQSTGGKEASREIQETWGPGAITEYDERERNRSRFDMNENPLVVNNYDKKDSEPFTFVHNYPAPHEPDVALSDVCESDADMHHLKCDLAEGSLKRQIEEGHLGSKSWNKREIIPCILQQQSSGNSLITNLSKKFLNEEGNTTNPLDLVLDARTYCCSFDDDNNLLLEHKLDCENMCNLSCSTVTGLIEGSSKMFDSGFNTYGLVGDPHGKNEEFGFSKLREPQPTNKFPSPVMISSSTKVDSWPQFKRRKVEDKQINCLSVSPKFRVQNFHNIWKGFRSSYSENNSKAVSDVQVSPCSREGNANKSSEIICQNMECHLTEGNMSSPRCQVQEVKLGFEERITVVENPSMFNHENSGSYLVSSLSKQITGDSQVMLVEGDSKADPTCDVFAAKSMCDELYNQKFLHVENDGNPVDADDLTSSERTLLERKSHLKVASQLFSHSAVSPHINDLAFDQNLPGFESFVLNEKTESRGMGISEDEINFSELNHSCTSTRRVSILEQLCRTASRQTPLPHISSTFELLRTKDQYLSVKNGLLEHEEMKSNLSMSDDSGYHLRDIFVDKVDSDFEKVSYSESLPYSDTRFGWNSKGSNSPPLGKLWERISSNSFSSEKRLSFNPELTCFPIEEDPSVSEENENADDLADNIENGICSAQINTGANREPLSDITEVGLNPLASVSVADKCLHRGRFDSINTEVFSTTFNSVKQRLRNHCSNSKGTDWEKENQNFSVGANCIKKVGESLHNRFSKAKLSGTTSMKRRGKRPSEKVKRNNIVSNVTSFIPLVQQKQAAAVCAVKRDVKVKALEAAEAARRLEEKKENERRVKKEAMKLERAKMEQENMRQKELDRKKKIEEMKKKDVDIITRKRLRDEEERKVKERKKKRIEEGRRVHRAQEEKGRAGKGLKEKLGGNMGKRMNDRQELDNREVTNQVLEKNGNEISLNKTETEHKTKQASIVSEICDSLSDCDGRRKSTNVSEHSAFGIDVANKPSQEKSYEISPYQCSDNEEDEEEDLPTKKFVPSWASKKCVALFLSSQQQIDPNVLFPRESFCSMDEVLLPRNLR